MGADFMKKQKIQYKRFSRETFGLFRFNFWPLVIFEILYSFCGSTIIFPVTGFILKHSLSAAGLFYITDSNISELLRHPALWIVGLALLLILAFYIYHAGCLLSRKPRRTKGSDHPFDAKRL